MQEMYSSFQRSQGRCATSAATATPNLNRHQNRWVSAWLAAWFTDTDLGLPCQDRSDKWCHSTADLTAWKYTFRCWSRRREVRVISFLTVSVAKTCSVTAAWSHLTADLFLWRLYERVTVGTTRTDAQLWFIFYDVGPENLVFKLADSGMNCSLKLAFLVTRSGHNYMQLQLSSCSLCSAF